MGLAAHRTTGRNPRRAEDRRARRTEPHRHARAGRRAVCAVVRRGALVGSTHTLSDPTRNAATPLFIRACRVVRAVLHLVQGLLTIACVFPIVPARRECLIRSWSA